MPTPWPSDPHKYVTAAQVAAYLGYRDLRAFHRDKPWRDANGFPPQPLKRRWRASQILAWEDARMRGALPLPAPANEDARNQGPCLGGPARQALDRIRADLARKEARHG